MNREIIYLIILPSCCLCIFVIAVVLIPTLLVLSIQDVGHDELGILYNTVSREYNEEQIFEEGKYATDPAEVFFLYRRTFQTLTLESLECQTSEGLQMQLRITVQYQIIRDQVINIFREFGEESNYQAYIEAFTRSDLKDTCTNFTGMDFFNRRSEIEFAMGDSLNEVYTLSNSYAQFQLVQLRNVQHPEPFAEANRELQLAEQEQVRLINVRQQELINAETRLQTTIAEIETALTRANGTATAVIEQANQEALAITTRWEERAQALLAVMNSLGITVDELVDGFVRYDTLINVDRPFVRID